MGIENFRMNNLKEIREKKNITQIKLSTEIEVSQEIISHYEIGKSKPNIDNLNKLADYFNCSTDYLLGRTNNPAPIRNLSVNEKEIAFITMQYNSLSSENKKHLICFLDYLCNKK